MKKAETASGNKWEITDVQCLVRHIPSRKYYGRFTLWGKQKWIALGTDVYSVAKLRLADQTIIIEKLRAAGPNVRGGKATVGELMQTYMERTQNNDELKETSKISRETALKKVKKTWPGIEQLEPKWVSPEAVQAWTAKFKREGTKFTPPGAKTILKGNSATSVNRAIDTLRRVLDIAVQQGQIHTNPVVVKPLEGTLKKKVTKKKLVLPSREEAKQLIIAMRDAGAHGGWGVEAAFLCSFLKMSGARIGEVPVTLWKYVNWDKKTLFLAGYKTETSERTIPLFPELEKLLRDLIEWRKAVASHRHNGQTFLDPSDRLFRIKECQKSIDAACVKIGITRITHHDWRHLFATLCLESGVDVMVVAKWMGHCDGGVLVLKTYGHVLPAHGQNSAGKVRFH